jgi:hypothetical protein
MGHIYVICYNLFRADQKITKTRKNPKKTFKNKIDVTFYSWEISPKSEETLKAACDPKHQ